MASSFVTTLETLKHRKLEKALKEQGFSFHSLAHAKFSAKKEGISCTLYESGKLVVQGKQSPEWIDFFLEPEILGRIERSANSEWHKDFQIHLGSDESGKGDLFGPLCVACVLVEESHLQKLHDLGVQDSKNIADAQIKVMALGIWKSCPCSLKILTPALYNPLWQKFKNLNRLLAWVHTNLIHELYNREKARGPCFAIVDQFSSHSGIRERLIGLGVDLELREYVRAESDAAVAAASVLARAAFLKNLQQCSARAGVTLPKGSGAPAKMALKELLAAHPNFPLHEIAKTHFKTVHEVQDLLC